MHELFEIFVSLVESDSVETELVEVRIWIGFVVGIRDGWVRVGLGTFSERVFVLTPVVGLISCAGSFLDALNGS